MNNKIGEQYNDNCPASISEVGLDWESLVPDFATRLYLANPSITAVDFAAEAGLTLDEVRQLYQNMQTDENVKNITNSLYYPRRMMVKFAKDTVCDWSSDPEYANKFLSGQTVSARNLEVHATRGTCNYGCNMCLWSDRKRFVYEDGGVDESKLMNVSDWERLFKDAQSIGTRRIIFSGGGEPLLNDDLSRLISTAHTIGLKTHLYTNGFMLGGINERQWESILGMEQIRFSIHSSTNAVYDQIVSMPEQANALTVVRSNIKELLARRDNQNSPVKIGIGIVVQNLNYYQIESMAELACDLGVDFINFRQDKVAITDSLNEQEKNDMIKLLTSVRSRSIDGDFGAMQVDMSDDMTAMVNGFEQVGQRVGSCYAKFFRPAVSPFGWFAPCDLRAESRFTDSRYLLGNVKEQSLSEIVVGSENSDVFANCAQCMPSGETINMVVDKLVKDYETGIHYTEQPFFDRD
jgi:MoaA/NifB/PqqE/SkfB family radical SAM enzyme